MSKPNPDSRTGVDSYVVACQIVIKLSLFRFEFTLKSLTHDQLFLGNFSLTRSLAQKRVMPAFEKGALSIKINKDKNK